MARGLPNAPRWAWVTIAASVAAIVVTSYFLANRPEPPGFVAPALAAEPTPTAPAEFDPATAAVFADFSALADDADFSTAATGQPLRTVANTAGGSDYRIVGGRLTNGTTAPTSSAAYLEVDLGAPAQRVGAEFTLTASPDASDVDRGGVMVGGWRASIVGSYPLIPASSAHFVVAARSWQFGLWLEESQSLELLGGGEFTTPLATDGVTVHRTQVLIEGATATVLLPDGSSQQFTDPRIGKWGLAFPCWEVYQQDASVDSRAGFVRVWAV